MAMILPKGIVINTTSIYKEVASYPTIPADKIWEYWHVYTVTNKKLKDPTARRLENFWWQVWGSDRRHLSGQALARLFEDISVGPTIVPLHGPANRWEGSDVPPLTKQSIVAHITRRLQPQTRPPEPPRMPSNDTSIRSLSSSASKPPPSHPILKKNRSPLANAPKPTARFVSPPESKSEDVRDHGMLSTASTAITATELFDTAAHAPPAIRGSSAASTCINERPTLSRRMSSEHSGPNAGKTFTGPSSAKSRRASNQMRKVVPVLERAAGYEAIEDTENGHQDTMYARSPLSAKAAGKRPALQRTLTQDRPTLVSTAGRPSITTSAVYSLTRTSSDLLSPISTRTVSLPRNDTDNLSLAGSVSESSSAMGRSISLNGFARKASMQGLFTGATATTTNVAAQGQIIDQAGSLPVSSISVPTVFQNHLSSHPSTTSLLESRMAPTQPSQTASVPMARTRSQLTLLLEREKTRSGEGFRF
ncbi:hypothetical protein AAL_05617 [Moelleriella libera RCEF 2490]|uniref:Nitrogen regulatory protein areA GATA-like domain-containing protein n=1 Tax=Moelleriella libera RCEF 2490 TaxID=1081109 RepID=A0A167ZY05_9HYPO|nr:hypothetical protein AAL_05617 [Moelleriella libera RCEF 2490]